MKICLIEELRKKPPEYEVKLHQFFLISLMLSLFQESHKNNFIILKFKQEGCSGFIQVKFIIKL